MKHPSQKNRTVMSELDARQIAGAMLPVELSAEQRSRMRARIAQRVAPPANTSTIRGATAQWNQAWPKVWVQQLYVDPATRAQTVIVRMEPGGVIPAHDHGHEEECLVLDGEICMGDYFVRRGDFHVAHAGSQHRDIVAPTGALLMIRSTMEAGGHAVT